LLPCILFEKYIYIFALEMASPGKPTVPVVSAPFRSVWLRLYAFWWFSGVQTYQVAYVIVKAANAPRPGQWLLERSTDGVQFSVWQYFAMTDSDCWNMFGVQPTVGVPRFAADDEVHCSSAFSHLNPLENGEASLRAVHR